MRILHIGDFHFKANKNNYDQNLMIDKLVESLKNKKQIDFIFFSGDLVNAGKNINDFISAYNALLLKLSEELNIDGANIIISQGNHDINRDECSKGIIAYFDREIDSNEKLNEEVLSNSKDYLASLKPSLNFKIFLETVNKSSDIIRELYSLHVRNISNRKFAIVCLNSAWLSSEFRKDNELLMFPIEILKDALNAIKEMKIDYKFLLMHHPLYYFKEFNSTQLEDLINKEFNIILSGHIHREQIITKFASNNGIYNNTTQATLTFDKDGEIGYSILECNFNDDFSDVVEGYEYILLERGQYSKKENKFVDLNPINVPIPCGAEKSNQNKLRIKITSKFNLELKIANELLLDYEQTNKYDFLESFTNPYLTTNPPAETSISETNNQYDFNELLISDSNFLFFGRDKCGKTTILKKIQLHLLKNYSTIGKIPLYIDYKDLENKSTSKINIKNIIIQYYEINNADASKIIDKSQLVLLIDNLDTKSSINEIIINFLKTYKNIQFIMCSDFLASRIYFDDLDSLEYTKLYFNDLRRKEIRLYTEKNKNLTIDNKEKILERITTICKQLQLPVNYWTVSLILLIYKKSNDDYNKNIFGMLDMCVDEILQKKQLVYSKSKLTFEQYKEICSDIAHYLLTKHRDSIYSATYYELITFLNEIIFNRPRLVSEPKDLLNYLIDSGIFKIKNNRYTFRLNGIFEYFFAYYINNHPEFKDEIVSNDRIYLTFKNELEIYSGLNRNDEKFVLEIFNKTKRAFCTLVSEYIGEKSIDIVLIDKMNQTSNFSKYIRELKINNPIKHAVQDAIKDSLDPINTQSDVHIKVFVNLDILTPEILETYLGILAKVFKNSDRLINTPLIYEIFDYLVTAYCVFGFYLIDQVALQAKLSNLGENTDEESDFIIGENILKIITNFIPLLAQSMLYEGLGHNSIIKILKDKIQEYKVDYKNNQYKLYMLYFLLIDIDINEYKELIDEVFEFINLNPLKVSTLFKINFYLAFKAYQKKELEQFFKSKVQKAQLRLDNKIDPMAMNKFLSKKEKGNIVKKNTSK